MDQQIFLLNSNKKSESIFRIEEKLRYLSTNFGTKLCALYDLTKVPIERGLFSQSQKKLITGEAEAEQAGKEAGALIGKTRGKLAGK